jgi:hypothetical protein
MTLPRYSVLATVLMLALAVETAAQHSPARIQFATQYVAATSNTDGVTDAAGYGLAMSADWRPTRLFGGVVQVGFDRIGITQVEPVERWDWAYWNRYYGPETRDLIERPEFEAVQDPVQEVLIVGAAVMPAVNLGVGALDVQLAVGASIGYYSRRLRLEENWTRHYPEIEYDFSMQFRNYAEDKTGVVYGADARLGAGYRLSRIVTLGGAMTYRHLLDDSSGDLPLNDFIALQLGIAFKY